MTTAEWIARGLGIYTNEPGTDVSLHFMYIASLDESTLDKGSSDLCFRFHYGFHGLCLGELLTDMCYAQFLFIVVDVANANFEVHNSIAKSKLGPR